MVKKVMRLSSETLCQLERKETEGAGAEAIAIPGSPASNPTCCP